MKKFTACRDIAKKYWIFCYLSEEQTNPNLQIIAR